LNLSQLTALFARAGATKLYAKRLAENDNSKNQIYFAGAVEALNVFPSEQIFAENTTKKGPSFKARLNFAWLQETGEVARAPKAQLILYSQYPEVRFSGFLDGCAAPPSDLMADRKRAERFTPEMKKQLVGRILFLGVTPDRRVIGYVAAGTSEIAHEFMTRSFPSAFVVFKEVPLPNIMGDEASRVKLLAELRRINRLGWIDSKQLDRNGGLKPCNAPQCGGFTLEAELGIAKNSEAEPDYLGWEVKQFGVDDLDLVESSKPITLLTPEPTGGFYKEHNVQAFVRKFGYADKSGKVDRLNFGGRHFVGLSCAATSLTMELRGYDAAAGRIINADGCVALVSVSGEMAATWSFAKLLEHWSRKHTKAVYVPSLCRKEPSRQYHYGSKVRLAQRTDPLRLLKAFATRAVYYDPGIKLENCSTAKPTHKKRSQFRVASKKISALYETVELVEL
jgi:hypothetical protein